MSVPADIERAKQYEAIAAADCSSLLGVEVANAELIHDGRQNTIVVVADTEGGKSCVRYRTATEFWYEDCIKEPFVESLGIVDIPAVLHADDKRRPQLLISEFVEGTLLHELTLNDEIAEGVGRLMADVHVPSNGASNYLDFVEGKKSDPEASWSGSFVEDFKSTAIDAGYEVDSIDAFLMKYLPTIEAAESSLVLVHNDVHFKNMILRPIGRICLLDWDSAVIAPPEKDFVKLMDWSHHNEAAVDTLIQAYEKSRKYQLNPDLLNVFRIYSMLRQIVFQSKVAQEGLDQSKVAQGGFFADNTEQMQRLSHLLDEMEMPRWVKR